jgi:hypothetical protein
MARNWLCVLGRHKYVQRSNEAGEVHTECARCGQWGEELRPGGDVPPFSG